MDRETYILGDLKNKHNFIQNLFPDFNQKMYDYLYTIIENIIKDHVFSVNNLSS